MRVIAGSAKGRRLRTAAGLAVRPTADRVKEALFSMLGSRFTLDGAELLDLYAGSGALGIEGLSRGASAATFVEHDGTARRILGENLRQCGFETRATVLASPVERALRSCARERRRFDGVLLDPPYGRGLVDATLRQLADGDVVRPGGWVAVEHHADEGPDTAYGDLQLTAAKRYGKTALALFSKPQGAE
ncbi:MAG: 16S rRNA (guanine(966)-N(2))-methyltransferase RsmD [Candidatus Binatia bacterium]